MHDDAILQAVTLFMVMMFTATMVALAARRLNFPFTILLVVIGLLIGWGSDAFKLFHFLKSFELTPDIVLFVFLPVLIFESAFNLDARRLLKNAFPIVMLAVPALLISTAVVGGMVHFMLALPLGVALLFGALISATDPVAVVALFKEMGAPKRLHLLVEGESLFNDGTALVVFKIILGVLVAGSFTGMTVVHGVVSFFVVSVGGILIGIVLGYVFSKIIEYVENDFLVEITLTTILAHTAFITAEHYLHVSGVMATVAAGLTLGSYGRNKISPPVQEHMAHFWEYFSFICNSLIFLLVGLSVDLTVFSANIGAIMIASVAVLLARGVAVFGIFPVVQSLNVTEPVSLKFQSVIAWGGLRGALAIVMALSIPDELEQKPFLLALTLGIVLFTLFVNGLTVKRLMHLLGLDRYSVSERFERLKALLEVKERTYAHLLASGRSHAINPHAIERASHDYVQEIGTLRRDLDDVQRELGQAEAQQLELSHCLLLERNEYRKLFYDGVLSESNLKDMLVGIERQLDRLKEGKEVYQTGRLPLGRRIGAWIEHSGIANPLVSHYKTGRIATSYEIEHARYVVSSRVLEEITDSVRKDTLSAQSLIRARALYERLSEKAMIRMQEIRAQYPEYVEKTEENILRRLNLRSEIEEFHEMAETGVIPEKVYQEMEHSVGVTLRLMKMRPVQELQIPPVKLLGMIPYFSGLDAEQLQWLASQCHARSYLTGDQIVRQGQSGDSLYIIGRGRVSVTIEEAGEEIRLAELNAGEFFGETALLHPQPRTATVTALTPCTLLELSREKFLPFLEHEPGLRGIFEEAYRQRVLNTYLVHVPELHALDNDGRALLASVMTPVFAQEGQVLCAQGTPAVRALVIADGEATVEGAEGAAQQQEVLGVGQHMGFAELLSNGSYDLHVLARTEVRAYALERGALVRLMQSNPGLRSALEVSAHSG